MPGIGHAQESDEDDQFFFNIPKTRKPTRPNPQKLSLITDLAQPDQPYTEVSLVPTPLLTTSVPVFTAQELYSPSQRVASTSVVPDKVPSIQLQSPTLASASPRNSPIVSTHSATVERSESLHIPKRTGPQAQVVRSVSVGGPQRQPSTVLHREKKSENGIDSALGDVPEEVYLAADFNGLQTAWKRVKFAGKGSFSDVVLAKPALQFVKPEFVEQVRDVSNLELAYLEDEQPSSKVKARNCASLLAAVKITNLKPEDEESQLKFFQRDLEVMQHMPHHPSLMRLIGYFVDFTQHRRAITVLPYCPGGDLFDMVAKHRSKMSSLLIRRLFVDVCSAVVFLHENLIVHRDIKLENVLLDVKVSELLAMEHPEKYEMPLAVLTDMGLARRIDADNPMLTTRCGSDDYVPPEIMLGQPHDGRETDSWALGVLLYAMMEGRLPFDAPPPTAHMEGARARLRTAHRIARVDWCWHKRRDPGPEWKGGVEVVEGCLKRRANRRLARDTLRLPWVFEALPRLVHDPHNVADLWQLFVQ